MRGWRARLATAFQNPESYFHRYASLSETEARDTARRIWSTINGVNLRENILPRRTRADLILEKGPDHAIERVHLRKIWARGLRLEA